MGKTSRIFNMYLFDLWNNEKFLSLQKIGKHTKGNVGRLKFIKLFLKAKK